MKINSRISVFLRLPLAWSCWMGTSEEAKLAAWHLTLRSCFCGFGWQAMDYASSICLKYLQVHSWTWATGERERENVSQGWVQAMEVLYLLLQGHNQYAYHCRWTLCEYTGTDWTDAKCPESKWRMFGSCFHQLRSQKHAEGLEWSLVTLGLLSSRISCLLCL